MCDWSRGGSGTVEDDNVKVFLAICLATAPLGAAPHSCVKVVM